MDPLVRWQHCDIEPCGEDKLFFMTKHVYCLMNFGFYKHFKFGILCAICASILFSVENVTDVRNYNVEVEVIEEKTTIIEVTEYF